MLSIFSASILQASFDPGLFVAGKRFDRAWQRLSKLMDA